MFIQKRFYSRLSIKRSTNFASWKRQTEQSWERWKHHSQCQQLRQGSFLLSFLQPSNFVLFLNDWYALLPLACSISSEQLDPNSTSKDCSSSRPFHQDRLPCPLRVCLNKRDWTGDSSGKLLTDAVRVHPRNLTDVSHEVVRAVSVVPISIHAKLKTVFCHSL